MAKNEVRERILKATNLKLNCDIKRYRWLRQLSYGLSARTVNEAME
jgi:hypothetical protein